MPVNLVKRSFTGLANTIGLPLLPELVLWTEPELGPGGEPVSDTPSFEVDEPAVNRTSLFLAILYFAVFFVVGLTAFVTSIARPSVPELLANCAWVWLGSIITSGYAFFTLSGESATN
ncbi:MAG: hypothetical protein GXY79_08930 [Chloroflexi bacterium]|nr:hypothetical protein [Chloroflexota bacterium]